MLWWRMCIFRQCTARYDCRALVAQNAARPCRQGCCAGRVSLTLGVAPDWDETFLTGFAKALAECLARFNMPLGGDTVRSATGFVSVTGSAWACADGRNGAAPMRGQAMMFMLPAQSVTALLACWR